MAGSTHSRNCQRFAISTVIVTICGVVFIKFHYPLFEVKKAETLVKENRSPVRKEVQKISAAMARTIARQKNGSFLGAGTVPFDLLSISTTEAQRIFHKEVTEITHKCPEQEHFGPVGGGGYTMCMQPAYKFKRNDCLVYSFGINNDWSFDDAVYGKYGCEVHSFDPSMGKPDHMHKPKIHFHNLGLWGNDVKWKNGWEMKTLASIVKMLNHTNRIIDYIKVDAEGAEWPLLEHIVKTGIHRQFKQIALEIHTPRRGSEGQLNIIDYAEIIDSFRKFRAVGFRPYLYHHANLCCGPFPLLVSNSISKTKHQVCCYELFFTNAHFQ